MTKRAWVVPLLVGGALLGAAPGFGGAVAAAPPTRSAVIVVGAPELLWSDVDAVRTPRLWQLAGDSALGSLSVKAADPVRCPDDGWLTLGAGNRATAGSREGSACGSSGLVAAGDGAGGATVAGFVSAYGRNAGGDDGARLGALGDALAASGGCVSAAGAPAALAAADSHGLVASYRDDALAAAGDPAFLRRCAVTIVAATASNADQVVAAVAASAPRDATLLVVGVSDMGSTAHLQVAIASGSGFPTGVLASASTRRAPFVQLVDVAPTVLALRGLDVPSSMIGQPWHRAGGRSGALAHEVKSLARLDLAAGRQADAIVPFWVSVVVLMVAACLFAWWIQRPSREATDGEVSPSGRWPRRAALACAWCATLPAASFLAGLVAWWTASLPLLVLGVATAVAALALTSVAVALEAWLWRGRPFGLAAGVGVVTFAVIALDLVTGARLQIFTMAGYSPLVAGRFAGVGNVAFGVFAAGALLAAAGARASLGAGRPAALVVGAVGVAAVAVDGAPPWGSDVGGVLALVPSFAVLAWLLAGRRVSWRLASGGVALAVAVVVAFALADYARPAADQTHLGRFVGDLLHGGAWTIVRRKSLADVHLLTHSVLTLLVPVLVVVAIWLLRAPRPALRRAFAAAPGLRPVLVAIVVMSVVGAVVNDSGVAIPALAVLVALPATMSVMVATPETVRRAPAGEPNGRAAAC